MDFVHKTPRPFERVVRQSPFPISGILLKYIQFLAWECSEISGKMLKATQNGTLLRKYGPIGFLTLGGRLQQG